VYLSGSTPAWHAQDPGFSPGACGSRL
jgi:hypothetical protein